MTWIKYQKWWHYQELGSGRLSWSPCGLHFMTHEREPRDDNPPESEKCIQCVRGLEEEELKELKNIERVVDIVVKVIDDYGAFAGLDPNRYTEIKVLLTKALKESG